VKSDAFEVTRAYNHHDYAVEKRQALEILARHLAEITYDPGAPNTISISQ
jgi:hypothetical protein